VLLSWPNTSSRETPASRRAGQLLHGGVTRSQSPTAQAATLLTLPDALLWRIHGQLPTIRDQLALESTCSLLRATLVLDTGAAGRLRWGSQKLDVGPHTPLAAWLQRPHHARRLGVLCIASLPARTVIRRARWRSLLCCQPMQALGPSVLRGLSALAELRCVRLPPHTWAQLEPPSQLRSIAFIGSMPLRSLSPLSALAQLTALSVVGCYDSGCSRLEGLSVLTGLRALCCQDCEELESIKCGPSSRCLLSPGLAAWCACSSPALMPPPPPPPPERLSPLPACCRLGGLAGLTSLDCRACYKLTELVGLSALSALQMLRCDQCYYLSCSSLGSLTQLTRLTAGYCHRLTAAVTQLRSLRSLSCEGAYSMSLAGVASLPALTSLRCSRLEAGDAEAVQRSATLVAVQLQVW